MANQHHVMDLATIAQRLVVVEEELAQLKQRVQPSDQPWYLRHAGRFADDPEFDDMVRLGREIREADTGQ